MMNPILDDTIFALATPQGVGSIAVVRISGPSALNALNFVLHKKIKLKPRHAHLVKLKTGDDAIVLWFKAPGSFTGEDIVEIQCTGSLILVDNLLKLLKKIGLRPAGPGEFSYRAVINGRMSLEEAEKLNASINAKTVRELEIILSTPSLEKKLNDFMALAVEVLADLESDIEFQEQSSPAFDRLVQEIRRLYTQGELTARISKIPSVLLYGPPNCGKSTLFNAILGYERAIVSSTPGTTRDYIEAEIRHQGISFRLIDTAGTRKTEEKIEALGVEKTHKLLQEADVIVAFTPLEDPRAINITSKIDMGVKPTQGSIGISGHTGEGVGQLLDKISKKLQEDILSKWNTWIPQRAQNLLKNLKEITENAAEEELPELKSYHMMRLVEAIRGYLEAPAIDLYGEIFSRFCIGK